MRKVIGIGHAAGGDDAVGIRVIDLLRDCPDLLRCKVSDPMDLILEIGEASEIVIIDAMVGASAPLQWLQRQDLVEDSLASSHGLSLVKALDLASRLFPQLPPIHILGIAIDLPSGYDLHLSPAAEEAARQAAEWVGHHFDLEVILPCMKRE